MESPSKPFLRSAKGRRLRDKDPEHTFRYQAKCRENSDEHAAKAEEFELISHKGVPQITELWYPPRDKEKYTPIADYAKSVCNGKDGRPACPVRAQCLKEALDSDETHGIWGGMSHREWNALKRKFARKGKSLDTCLQNY